MRRAALGDMHCAAAALSRLRPCRPCRPCQLLPSLWRSSSSSAVVASALQGESPRPEVLWSPGEKADETQTQRLAGKIGILCRDSQSVCVVGARGELPTARAMRAIAQASELGLSALEVQAFWHRDPGDERSLRLRVERRYPWTSFKRRWAASFAGKVQLLPVTPHTDVHRLALALVTEQRKVGGVVLKLNPKNSTVMSIAAKALATLPHVATDEVRQRGSSSEPLRQEALAAPLVCVLRWPKIQNVEAAKFVYAHLLKRHSDTRT